MDSNKGTEEALVFAERALALDPVQVVAGLRKLDTTDPLTLSPDRKQR